MFLDGLTTEESIPPVQLPIMAGIGVIFALALPAMSADSADSADSAGSSSASLTDSWPDWRA